MSNDNATHEPMPPELVVICQGYEQTMNRLMLNAFREVHATAQSLGNADNHALSAISQLASVANAKFGMLLMATLNCSWEAMWPTIWQDQQMRTAALLGEFKA